MVRAQAVRVFLTPLPKRAVGAGGKCQIASPGKGCGLAACQGGTQGVIFGGSVIFRRVAPRGDLVAAPQPCPCVERV